MTWNKKLDYENKIEQEEKTGATWNERSIWSKAEGSSHTSVSQGYTDEKKRKSAKIQLSLPSLTMMHNKSLKECINTVPVANEQSLTINAVIPNQKEKVRHNKNCDELLAVRWAWGSTLLGSIMPIYDNKVKKMENINKSFNFKPKNADLKKHLKLL